MIRTRLTMLLAFVVAGCSGFQPFVTAPPSLSAGQKDPGPRVAICYNSYKTEPEKVRALAQSQCPSGTTAERIDTDYWLETCPVMTPGRATFVCKPVK